MDQLFMWYGVEEMRAGRFHMPRYFGQDYGSMLEAWISVPFTFVNYNKLLPLAAYFLCMLPYGLMVFAIPARQRLWGLVLVLAFLGLMSVEYIAIGAMPRDMSSGLAITALSLPFLRGKRWFHRLLVGFFCLLGWSFNANAAPFGAVITLVVLFSEGGRNFRTWLWVGLGYLIALGVHGLVEWFYILHPELIIHRKWPLDWQWFRFEQGITHLSRHWGRLVPFFHNYGGLYLAGFAGMTLAAIWWRKKALLIATLVLSVLMVVTLGLEKIHDAFDAIYFSFERMYFALPVSFLFLLLLFKPGWRIALCVAFLSITSMLDERINIEEKILELRDPDIPSGLTIMDLEQMQWRCEELEVYWKETEAQALFYGPGDLLGDWVMARGCECITEMHHTIRPEYERKTWELRALDQPKYSSFLWISPELSDSLLTSLEVPFTKVDSLEAYGVIYSIQGDGLNPMEIYKRAGFESVDY